MILNRNSVFYTCFAGFLLSSEFFSTTGVSAFSVAVPPRKSRFAAASNSRALTHLYSTVIEKPAEKVKENVADASPKSDKKSASDADTRLPAFLVRLWNDPFNKREFVARCLAEVCGKSDSESFQIMMQAHKQGMGLIGQYDFEIAELYTTSLKTQGLMVDMVPVDDE